MSNEVIKELIYHIIDPNIYGLFDVTLNDVTDRIIKGCEEIAPEQK